MIKTCPQCQRPFHTPATITKYCSKACYGISQRKPPHLKRKKGDYYLENRERIIARESAHRRAHIAEKRDYNRTYQQKLRQKVISFLGGRCKICGFSDSRALQIDHVHGGGNKELRSGLSYYTHSRNVMSDTTGKYQLLCANCNWIKKHVQEETTKKFKDKDRSATTNSLHIGSNALS